MESKFSQMAKKIFYLFKKSSSFVFEKRHSTTWLPIIMPFSFALEFGILIYQYANKGTGLINYTL